MAPRRIVKSRLVTAQDRVRGLMCTIALSSCRSASRSLFSSICRLSMDNATVCVWSSADGRRHSRCIVALNALVHQVQTPARPRSDVYLINIPSGWRSTGCCFLLACRYWHGEITNKNDFTVGAISTCLNIQFTPADPTRRTVWTINSLNILSSYQLYPIGYAVI